MKNKPKRKVRPGVAVLMHIGRKVPKGFEELPGGIHLGRGMWMLPMKPITLPQQGRKAWSK